MAGALVLLLHCSEPKQLHLKGHQASRRLRDIKYGAPRAGLPEAALIQQIAIPPDTWVGKDEDAQLVRLTLPEGVPPGATLPAVHVAKARSSREGFAGFFAPG